MSINKLKILALIPARGGSKGVPKKNIKPMAGKPLIYYSIDTAIQSKYINKIIVSTDSQEILDLVSRKGVEIPFLRPSQFAQDGSLDEDYFFHCLSYLEKEEGYIPDLIVLLRPTTPLRDSNILDNAIEFFLKNKIATSLRSAHEVSESPFKWFKIKDDYYEPISSEYSLIDTNNPRQFFPKVYIPNGYIDILKSKVVGNNIYGDKILSYITPFSYEIDTKEDFEYIEYLIEKRDNK